MQFSLLINTFKITCAGLPGNASTYSATKVCTLSFLHSVFTPNCTFSGLYDNCGNKRKDFSDLCRRVPRRYDCVHPLNSFFTGASQFLVGLGSVISCSSEAVMFFGIFYIFRHFSHATLMAVGLVGYIFRFCVFASVTNPWLVLPVEIFQGGYIHLL